MANVIDVIKQDNADQADAQAKTQAAIAANSAASAAVNKASATRATLATLLKKTGEVFVRNGDGSITTYDSPDGVTVVPRSPLDAASLAVPDDGTDGTGPDTGGTVAVPPPPPPVETPVEAAPATAAPASAS